MLSVTAGECSRSSPATPQRRWWRIRIAMLGSKIEGYGWIVRALGKDIQGFSNAVVRYLTRRAGHQKIDEDRRGHKQRNVAEWVGRSPTISNILTIFLTTISLGSGLFVAPFASTQLITLC